MIPDVVKQFKQDIRSFLTETGMSRTQFGALAMRDPHAWFNWFEKGVVPKLDTISRIYRFMDTYRKKHVG